PPAPACRSSPTPRSCAASSASSSAPPSPGPAARWVWPCRMKIAGRARAGAGKACRSGLGLSAASRVRRFLRCGFLVRWRRAYLDGHVGILRLHVRGEGDRNLLRTRQRLLPGIEADAISGEVAARPQLPGLRIGDDDDRLVVDLPRGRIVLWMRYGGHARPLL